jgi:hypothetical protein
MIIMLIFFPKKIQFVKVLIMKFLAKKQLKEDVAYIKINALYVNQKQASIPDLQHKQASVTDLQHQRVCGPGDTIGPVINPYSATRRESLTSVAPTRLSPASPVFGASFRAVAFQPGVKPV